MAKKTFWDWALTSGISTGIGKGATGTEGGIVTQNIQDKLKTAVSSPLSSYLAGEVEKGLPRYSGALSADLDPEATNRYNEFIGLNPSEFFNKNIADPASKRYFRDFQPLVDEGYAGNLRGSGRFGANEDSYNRFASDLATQEASFVPNLYNQQLDQASKVWAIRDAKVQREYEDWFKSLPQNNPAITQALQFINGGTGNDTFAGIQQGSTGWLPQLAQTAALAFALA